MNPAYSVIFFTTASGAGYGAIVWLVVLALIGIVPLTAALGASVIVVSLALITAASFSFFFFFLGGFSSLHNFGASLHKMGRGGGDGGWVATGRGSTRCRPNCGIGSVAFWGFCFCRCGGGA